MGEIPLQPTGMAKAATTGSSFGEFVTGEGTRAGAGG